MQVTAVLSPASEGGYTAYNPETGTTSQGESIEEALANLREAVELYLEEFPMKFDGAPIVTSFNIAA
jgi:predicted RNase H-like HicB family nuclease|tara:strand:- start:937 stop:1137 length:201 start_codon:yes stop_codon:yes gene_type:complete